MIDKCSSKPNCVSSNDNRDEFYIKPLPLIKIENLKKIVLNLPGAKLVSETDSFLHIVFTSKLLKFKDDIKFEISGDKIEVSSQSRTGYSDLGVNRKRVEQIRQSIEI